MIIERKEYPFQIPEKVQFPLIASFVGINTLTNLIYVTNTASNTISSIEGKDDENTVRVNMDIQPSNAGFIECNGIRNTNQNTNHNSNKQNFLLQCHSRKRLHV